MSETGEGFGYVPADIKQEAVVSDGGVDTSGETIRPDAAAPPGRVKAGETDLIILYEDGRGGGEDHDVQVEAVSTEEGGEEGEQSAPEEREAFSVALTEREELLSSLSVQKQILRLSEQLLDLIENSLAGNNDLDEMGETLESFEQQLEALAEEIKSLESRLAGWVKSHFVNIRLMLHRLQRVHAVASGKETEIFAESDEEFEQSLLIVLQDKDMFSPAEGGARRLVMAQVHDRRAAISEVRHWGGNISS